MEPFNVLDAIAAPLPAVNVDTDQIFPARFLPKLRAQGLGPCLFRDLRFTEHGEERPEFVLNRPPYRGAAILVTGRNFGCGSSRESAVYALYDHGMRAIVSSSFGDIFYANCLKNGLLPVVLADEAVSDLLGAIQEWPGAHLRIELAEQTLIAPDGAVYRFDIDAMNKQMLASGLDEVTYTLSLNAEIDAFERRQDVEAEHSP